MHKILGVVHTTGRDNSTEVIDMALLVAWPYFLIGGVIAAIGNFLTNNW